MPITVSCACGQSYDVREEFAGQRVQCPYCKQLLTIPTPAPPRKTQTPQPVYEQRVVAPPAPVPEPPAPAARGSGVWLLVGICTVMLLFCGGIGTLVVVAGFATDWTFDPALSTQPVALGGTAPAPPVTTAAAPVTKPTVPQGPKLPDLPPPSERPFDGHLAPILAVAFSRDGSLALSAAGGIDPAGALLADNTVRVWDVATGKERKRLRNFRDGIAAAAFSPDGRLAVLAGAGKWENGAWSRADEGILHLWDLETDAEVRVLQGPKGVVFSLAFSPDGKRVLSGWADHSVRLYNVETAAEIHKLDGHGNAVTSVAFSPDGLYGLSGSADQSVRLWDLKKGTEKKLFPGHKDIVWAVAFSPLGTQVVSAGGMQKDPLKPGFIDGAKDYEIRLWDVAAGTEVRRFPGHTKAVLCLAFSRDGHRLLSGGADNAVRLWQVDTGTPVSTFEGHKDVLKAVEFFPDGRRALSGGDDRELHVWNLPPDLAELLAKLDDPDPKTRLDAVRLLPRYGAEVRPSLPVLFKALQAHEDAEFRTELLAVLKKLGPLTKVEAPPLVALFNDASFPAGRLYALEALAAVGADYPPTLPTLKQALGDKDLAVKRKALQLAGQLGAPAREALYPTLLELVADDNAEVAKGAADALGKMGKPTTKDLADLNDLLRKTKPAVVRFALAALADMGPDAATALPRITEIFTIKKNDADLRRLALAAATKVQADKKELVLLLKRGLKDDDDPEVNKQAVVSLATLAPDPDAVAAVLEALTHSNAAVAKTAEEQLSQIKFVKANGKALAAALRANKSEATRLRLMDALVALKPDTSEAGQALGEFLKDATGDNRMKIIAALGDLGDAGKEAGPALAGLLKDDDAATRFEAALALCKMRSDRADKAIPLVVAALRLDDDTDKDQLEREKKAHEALVKLGKPSAGALAKALDLGFIGPGLPNIRARMAVIRTLAEMGADAKEAAKALEGCSKSDPFRPNRDAAKEALIKIQ